MGLEVGPGEQLDATMSDLETVKSILPTRRSVSTDTESRCETSKTRRKTKITIVSCFRSTVRDIVSDIESNSKQFSNSRKR